MSWYKKRIGRWGEDIAAAYYRQKGYAVLDRNWRCRYGELDIVCRKGRTLFAIEVKTRRSLEFGYPEEAVTHAKRDRIMRCAAVFLEERKPRGISEIQHHLVALYSREQQVVLKVYTDFS